MLTQLLLLLLSTEDVKKQIISLGCGYDTHCYRIRTAAEFKGIDINYIEIDMPTVVNNKVCSQVYVCHCLLSHPSIPKIKKI